MPNQLEKFPFFHPDNFQLEKLLNEITAGHSFQNPEDEGGLHVENAENENSAPPDSVGDTATLEDVIGNLESLNMTRIKEELKISLEDLVSFYKSEIVSSCSSEEKSDTKGMTTTSMFKTSEDFKMELRVLAKQISTLNEQFAEARHLNFQENIDELSLLKTQQSNLLSVKEILTIFEEIKRGEFDTLDFFVTSDAPSDLLKGAKLLSKLNALTKSTQFCRMASGSDDALLSSTIFQYFDAFEKRIFMLYKKANQEDKVTAIDAFSQVILALNGSSELTSGAPL